MPKSKKVPAGFDKYHYYMDAVQNPEVDVDFYVNTFKSLKKRSPESLREDFCGTLGICAAWAQKNNKHIEHGVHLDKEPLEYGKKNIISKLSADQQKRVFIHNSNVLDEKLPATDICVAVNFSYYIFKKREELREYFKNAFSTLKKDSLFIIDCFGGSQCQEAIEEETVHKKYSYYWDQINFSPITNEAEFYIHFKLKGQKKIERVFYYDWRMWTIPELREILSEAGFKKTTVYWEGSNSKGSGNGVFKPTDIGEECDSWIAYVVAEN